MPPPPLSAAPLKNRPPPHTPVFSLSVFFDVLASIVNGAHWIVLAAAARHRDHNEPYQIHLEYWPALYLQTYGLERLEHNVFHDWENETKSIT